MRALLDKLEFWRASKCFPHFQKLPCQNGTEDGAEAHACEKVAFAAHGSPARCVVALERVIERKVHETGEGHGAQRFDFLVDAVFKAW